MNPLDLCARTRGASGFVWQTMVTELCVGCVEIKQVNLVLLFSAIGRTAGGRARLTPDMIDYRVISPVLADRKFVSQRTIRTLSPKATVLVYFSGSLIGVGAKTSVQALAAVYKAARLLNNYRWPQAPEFVMGNISFVNSVFNGTCHGAIDLQVLYGVQHANIRVTYEHDLFPGAIIRMYTDEGVHCGSITMYHTGNFVLLGCKNAGMLQNAAETLNALLTTVPGLCVQECTDGTLSPSELTAALQHMQLLNIVPEFEGVDIVDIGTMLY